MQNYQAQIAAQFDDPYSAQMFLNTIIKAIKKTQWDISALPKNAIKMGVSRVEPNGPNNRQKSSIITPQSSLITP